MKKKPSPIRKRTMMLVALSEKNYDPVSQRLICMHLKPFSERGDAFGEEEAERITSLVNQMSEEEVLRNL